MQQTELRITRPVQRGDYVVPVIEGETEGVPITGQLLRIVEPERVDGEITPLGHSLLVEIPAKVEVFDQAEFDPQGTRVPEPESVDAFGHPVSSWPVTEPRIRRQPHALMGPVVNLGPTLPDQPTQLVHGTTYTVEFAPQPVADRSAVGRSNY